MVIGDQEALRAALVDLEHLNSVAEKSRSNAEMLLRGLERLSNAESGTDSLTEVLGVLSSSVDDATVCVLTEEDGMVHCIAATDPDLSFTPNIAQKALKRAFSGKSVVLANSIAAAWWGGFCEDLGQFGSALFHPITPLERPAILVCLKKEIGAFSKDHVQRLQFFVPLAIQGMRQSERMAEVEMARQAAEKHAKTDFLTGLCNRLALEDKAKELVNQEDKIDGLWVALVDLNAFKPINDNFGHDAGDAVLIEIGQRLVEAFGDTAVAARLGGDEFGLLIPDLHDRDSVSEAGRKIVASFDAPIIHAGNEFRVGASIGLAPFDKEEAGLEAAIAAADTTMYSMKARKVTGYAIFEPEKPEAKDCLRAPDQLRHGLSKQQFVPYFQPKINMCTGAVIGFEALARWVHPTAGVQFPGAFLQPIENAGLSNEFTRSIVSGVLDNINRWRRNGLNTLPVAINLSEVYLAAEEGVSDLIWMLEEKQIQPEDVVFEITEDVLIARSSHVIINSIHRLKEWGGRISLDDFGTGYGSLRHLLELPFDEIKIDRGFVSGIGKDRASEVILEAILDMAHGLDVSVVAEGVETREQSDYLTNLGCAIAQGYLYCAAVPTSEIERILSGQSSLLQMTG